MMRRHKRQRRTCSPVWLLMSVAVTLSLSSGVCFMASACFVTVSKPSTLLLVSYSRMIPNHAPPLGNVTPLGSSKSFSSSSLSLSSEAKQSRTIDSTADAAAAAAAATSSSSSSSSSQGRRAGESGYSVLRQPVQWNPDQDPSFNVPLSLSPVWNNPDETSNGSRETMNPRSRVQQQQQQQQQQQDESWWNQRRRQQQQQQRDDAVRNDDNGARRRSTTTATTITSSDDLDLLQRTLDTLDYPYVLEALREFCTTVPARQLVKEAAVQQDEPKKSNSHATMDPYRPLTATCHEGIQERYAAVREMRLLLRTDHHDDNTMMREDDDESESSLLLLQDATYKNRLNYTVSLGPPPLKGISFPLVELLEFAETQSAVLEGPELLEIVSMLDTLQDVSLWSSRGLDKVSGDGVEFVELPKLAGHIRVNATLQELLRTAFDEQQDKLSGTTFSALGILRQKVRTLKSDILQTVQTLLTTSSIASKLALESGGPEYAQVNGRLVIPIDQKYASSRNSLGIIHDASRSGKTVYVEPTEIVGPTNELRQMEAELRAEEARIWRFLTNAVLENRVDLETSIMAVGQLDLVVARVLLGRKLKGVIPTVGQEGIISLRDAKHPMLLLRGLENVVGSDIDLGANGNQGLVLTGPNSGGKTVILKLLGLVALMARNGIPVPARAATDGHVPRVDFFSPVLADIGDLQSVGGDLSTFSGHILVCREVLSNSGENALLLMDELGSGTDPRQGVAIAQALLEALLETGARVAITTHYLELKQLASSDHRFSVGGMQFVNGRPTYKLLPGTVGESFALAVAERLELPPSVLSRANELLDQETRQMGDLLRDLEDQKAVVDRQAEELTKKKLEMAELEEQMQKDKIRLEQKQLSARRDEAQKFATMLEDKERVLEQVLDKLKSDPSRKVVAKGWDDIRFVKRDALNEAENVPSVLARKKKANAAVEQTYRELVPLVEMREKPDLQVGDKLMVCKKGALFGKEAEILRLGNRLQVQVSGMIVQLKPSEVALPNANVQIPERQVNQQQSGPKNRVKAAEKAIQAERTGAPAPQPLVKNNDSSSLTLRTESNTIDVRGCNLEEAKSKCQTKFSSCLMSGRSTVYVLHGHGTAGVLKRKVREWLKSERTVVKRFSPADSTDGGDAFTKVELR